MVKHRSGTRWPDDTMCGLHNETKSTGFLVWPQNQGRRFPGLGFKTDSSGLVIWASKSLRWFSGLGFKIGSSSLVS
jgi:hypothetical protein